MDDGISPHDSGASVAEGDPVSAVIWALDETLLDASIARTHALGCAIEECVGDKVDGQALAQEHGDRAIDQLAWQLLGEDFPRLAETFDRHYAMSDAPAASHAGVMEVLEALLAHEIPMAVLSSQVSWAAVEELARSGLLRYFQSVVGEDDTDAHRPEPDPVFEALDRMAVDAGDAVFVVGGTAADVVAAREAGCRSIAALWAARDADALRAVEADFVAEEPAQVLEILWEASAQ